MIVFAPKPPYSGRLGLFRRQERVIGVALLIAAIEGRLVRPIQRRADGEARRQVGVGEERLAEGDEIGGAGGKGHLGADLVVTAIGDVGAFDADPLESQTEKIGKKEPTELTTKVVNIFPSQTSFGGEN